MYKTKNNPHYSHATTNSPLQNHDPTTTTTTTSPPLLPQPPPLQHHHRHNNNHTVCSHGHAGHRCCCRPPHSMFSQRGLMTFTSWLNRRRSRCVFLLLCSPLLIPFLCASFPFLCAAELCFYLLRRRRSRKNKNKKKTTSRSHLDNQGIEEEEEDEEQLQRCEEGLCGCDCGDQEVGLLQRYLEDQLRLVGSVVYECGDDFLEDTPSVDSNINTRLLG